MLEERLNEILARKVELRNQLTVEGSNISEIKVETDSLIAEEEEIRKKIKLAADLEGSANELNERGGNNMEKVYTRSSEEYRNGFLKGLMGVKLSEEEARAVGVVTSVEAGSAIPTQTMNLIIQALEQQSVLYNYITVTQIAGNVSFVVAPATEDAEWHGGSKEGTDATANKITLSNITLTGYELIKIVEISAKMTAMAIPAFEAWIVQEIAKKFAQTLEKAILSGTGTDEATGVLKANYITQTADFTKAGMTYADLMAIFATLPTMYHNNSMLIMPRKVFFTDILGMLDANKKPVVVQDPQSPAKFNVLGYPVLLNDFMPEDTILFGDMSYYRMNFSQPIEITSDLSVGFKSGMKVWRGLAVVDGKPTMAEALVLSKRKSA